MRTTHLLLDIEGTTCPISFVARDLFPYAKKALPEFLQTNACDQSVKKVIQEAWQEWRNDQDPHSQELLEQLGREEDDGSQHAIQTYLLHLIEVDRKSTALKDLQGRIWKNGYANGEIKTKLFPETLQAFGEWQSKGLKMAVYSSGSISAQQLLYQYTSEGDKRGLFCAWFDTRTGPKKESLSYKSITQSLKTTPESIAFISDSRAECDAAQAAGLQTLFSLRPENPDQQPGPHPVVTSLAQVISALKI